MPFIVSIVNYINDAIQANCSLLAGGTFYGIASVVARKKTQASPLEQLPGILVDHTQYITIEPNDKYALIIYHKIISNTYQRDTNNSYGDGYRQKATTDMQLIVWGDSKKLGIDQELESVVVYSIPLSVAAPVQRTLGLKSCSITPYSSTLDRLTVFRQEYPQSEFFLKPNHQFFSVRYRIESTFDKQCVDMCTSNQVLTFASAQTFSVGLTLVERFQVGKPGAPMIATSTEYSSPLIAGKKVFVMAGGLGLPVDDGTGKIDFTDSAVRHVRKLDAENKILFVGGVAGDPPEFIEIYTTN